jgi:hypothetical protein
MAWSGGTFTRANPTWASDAAGKLGIEPGRHDAQDNDFTTGINQCINKDGSNAMTGNLNLNTNKIVGLANGTNSTDAASWGQLTNGAPLHLDTVNNRVGVGTTTPTELLTVVNNTAAGASFRSNGNSAANELFVGQGGSGYAFVSQRSTDTILDLVCGDGSYLANGAAIRLQSSGATRNGTILFSTTQGGTGVAERMQIDNTGAKRFKNGYHYYEASAITSGAGTNALKYNTTTGLVTWDTSSRLIKDNIENCPLGLAAVLALKPRKYFRTDDQKNEVGFIADEVEQVVPEIVSYAQKSRFTGNEQDTEIVPSAVAYEKLTAVLCKAIQELNAKVTALENQLSATTVLP